MPDDFKTSTDAQNDRRREVDMRDYNDAIAGRDNGRNTHSGIRKAKDSVDKQSKKAQRAMLDTLLTDPTYAAAYKSAVEAYGRAQEAVYDGMAKAANELASAESAMKETLDSATTLEDGTKVFMAQDGSAYTEDGRKLNDDECAGIEWKEGSPHWEKYQRDQAHLTDAQKQQDYMSGLDKRLRGLHDELTDKDNPPSPEHIAELEKEIGEIEKAASQAQTSTNEFSVENSQNVIVPELNI